MIMGMKLKITGVLTGRSHTVSCVLVVVFFPGEVTKGSTRALWWFPTPVVCTRTGLCKKVKGSVCAMDVSKTYTEALQRFS